MATTKLPAGWGGMPEDGFNPGGVRDPVRHESSMDSAERIRDLEGKLRKAHIRSKHLAERSERRRIKIEALMEELRVKQSDCKHQMTPMEREILSKEHELMAMHAMHDAIKKMIYELGSAKQTVDHGLALVESSLIDDLVNFIGPEK